MKYQIWLPAALLLIPMLDSNGVILSAPKPTPEQEKYFDSEVRPLLKAHCLSCHGGEKKIKGGLDLTTRLNLLKGGDSGPVVLLDKALESPLLKALHYEDDLKMPPKGKLALAQIEVFKKWIESGAYYSASAEKVVHHGPPQVDEKARQFWAFRPVIRPTIPGVKDTAWAKNPVDAFLLAKMEEKGIHPNSPANKLTQLRRVYYVVTGLPPTLSEIEAFQADSSPDAYEKVVDRLLASNHFGEHWGRHWLDLVRYAETNSFERDGAKPFAYRYRDYLIRSFNQDKPYDQFIREQIAGDEFDKPTSDSIIATGYYRLGTWDDEPADRTLAYYDELDDIVAVTGQTFLGLTTNCSRCHDHKIDPFPQKDYYSLLAFFHGIRRYSTGQDSLRQIGSEDEIRLQQEKVANHRKEMEGLNKRLSAIEKEIRPLLEGGEKDDFKHDENRPRLVAKRGTPALTMEYAALWKKREEIKKTAPAALDQAMCVTEEGPRVRETFVHLRGNPQSKGEKVEPAFPSVLVPPDARPLQIPTPPGDAKTSGRRRVLADWLASKENPLTARVMVNRIFQYSFGRGLVRSSSNFGYMGTPPTHPELLDFLASEYVNQGWRTKPLLRMLLTSNAFRMSSLADPTVVSTDPENNLLSHFDLIRLSAEEVRDSVLFVSGNINLKKTSGPSVYPMIPPEVLAGQSVPGNGWSQSNPEDSAARSVYVHVKRSLALPLLAVFDAPDPDTPCPIRFTTTQPSQALGMINGKFINDQAAVFAEGLKKEAGNQEKARVTLALYKVMQRQPTPQEVERAEKFLADLRSKDSLNPEEAFRRFCLLALNLNEFVYLN